ncbi:Histone-lysine N-methyltransferase [Chlorella vulgaris]
MDALSPTPRRPKQASIEEFMKMSPKAQPAAPGRKENPKPPIRRQPNPGKPTPLCAEAVGRAVIKDFICEVSGQPRPFCGSVLAYSVKQGWYSILYEDGDSEDLFWNALHPLLAPSLPQMEAPAEVLKQHRKASQAAVAQQQPKRGKQAAEQPLTSQAAVAQPKRGKQAAEQPLTSQAAVAQPKRGKQAAAKPSIGKGRSQASAPAAARVAKDPQQAGRKAEHVGVGKKAAAAALPSGGAPDKKQRKRKVDDAAPAVTCASGTGSTKAEFKKRQRRQHDGQGQEAGAKGGKQPKSKPPAVEMLLPLPKLGQHYEYAPGTEPWRTLEAFNWPINEEPDLSAEAVYSVRDVARAFNRHFIRAEVDEDERVERIKREIEEAKLNGTLKEGIKNPSKRPDRVTESIMLGLGLAVRRQKDVGHFPGWDVGSRGYCRAELSCIGFHMKPVAGIDWVAKSKLPKGVPPFATSVMVSGWYKDDADSGAELWYTGMGGNDLLSTRLQVKDQVMTGANEALQGNIQLGIPVRVTRKQLDSNGHFGCAYIYDGLYDVTAMRRVRSESKTWVYQFCLKRRLGQAELQSECVTWGSISAKRTLVPKTRQGVVDLDISRGQEEYPVAAIDNTWLAGADHQGPRGDIPACTGLEHIAEETALVGNVVRGINRERIEELRAEAYEPKVQYVTDNEFVGRAAEKAAHLQPAVLPAEFADNPHAYLKQLNHGVAYNDKGQLFYARPVIYECCSAWTGCPDGKDCTQAVSQRATKYRLELFRTANGRGWGVRSLDTIPQYAFVCRYVGEVYDAAEHEHLVRTVEEQDAEYTFTMAPRPDLNWDGNVKQCPEEPPAAEFVVCGLRKRNVGAFLNHSYNIPPLTELTLDYGEEYVRDWKDGCKCGAPDCVSTRAAHPPAVIAATAAAGKTARAVEASTAVQGGVKEDDVAAEEQQQCKWGGS